MKLRVENVKGKRIDNIEIIKQIAGALIREDKQKKLNAFTHSVMGVRNRIFDKHGFK